MTGLKGSVGFKAETTPGTYATVDRWYAIDGANVDPEIFISENESLSAGLFGMPASLRTISHTGGKGGVQNLVVPTTKFGLILNNLLGGGGTPTQQASTAAYLQTHTLATLNGKALSMQVGTPYRNGTTIPKTGVGGKITSAEFSCGVGENLTCNLELDFMSASNSSQSLAAVSPGTRIPFNFREMDIKLGTTYGSESTISGVKKVTLKIERGVDTEAWYAAGAGAKEEQFDAGFTAISGTIEADWINKAQLEDLAVSQTKTNLAWIFSKTPAIASTYFPGLRFNIPDIFIEPTGQALSGAGVQSNSFSFVWRPDGTNNPNALYMSTDSAL